MTSWDRFVAQWKKDLKLWLFCMLSLSFFRAVFLLVFRDKIEKAATWTDIGKAFVNGMRYDGTVAAYAILIPLLLSVLCGFVDLRPFADRIRRSLGSLFAVLTVILSVITLAFFR
jgi:hypothetical protein